MRITQSISSRLSLIVITLVTMRIPDEYASFLRKIKHYEVGDLGEFIEKFSSTDSLIELQHPFRKIHPASFILDYTQKKYIYASSNIGRIIDRPVSYILDGGLDFGLSFWHKQDLEVYSRQVLPQNLKFLKDTPASQHADYLFSCNYRIKARRGECKNIFQQSVFIKSSDNGMPLAVMGLLFDVSKQRNDKRIYHAIHRQESSGRSKQSEIVLDKVYFLNEQEAKLTQREIEILKYLCDDLDSAQIAAKMNISRHTVDNHRRSLLFKTNSKTSVGLVRFAFTEGYV